MTQEEIIEKLKEAYKIVMGTDAPANITADSNLRTDLGLSSIGMLYYVIVLENMFSIRFENVGVSDFNTVNDVVKYIGDKAE